MKAITANYINSSLKTGKENMSENKTTFREVVLMNLFSNIMIKDNDIKKSSADNKTANMNHDHGFNLYKALEFSKDNPSRASHSLQMEMICSKLV